MRKMSATCGWTVSQILRFLKRLLTTGMSRFNDEIPKKFQTSSFVYFEPGTSQGRIQEFIMGGGGGGGGGGG